jgi:uncharacterized OB-fold protein
MFKWFGKVNFTPCTRVAEFAAHLKDGRMMAARCRGCGAHSFPPRADCEACMGRSFEFVEISGRGTLYTYTTVAAAPTGFERAAPYTIGVLALEEGGRALAWIGDTLPERELRIGMPLQLVPRVDDECEQIAVSYTLERAGTTWFKVETAGPREPETAAHGGGPR